jgi:hypothetical protein
MQQNPSSEAYQFAASQEILHILWNPKVHYRIINCPPHVSFLNQLNLLRAPHSTSWRSILILPSHLRLGLSSVPFSPRFNIKTLYKPLHSSNRATCHPIPFFSIWSPAQYWVRSTDHEAPAYEVYPLPCYLVPLRSTYSPQNPILKHPQFTFISLCQRPRFKPIQIIFM